jgi:hypothetical protein
MLNRKVTTSGKVDAFARQYGPWAVVFHHRLIAFLDKNGNCRADGYWLKGEIMPRVSEITPEDCLVFVEGLADCRLAVRYEFEGMNYIHMPGFRGEQVGLRHDRETREVPIPRGFNEDTGEWPEHFRKDAGRKPEGFRIDAG